MDLWIRSQDKTTLIKIDRIDIDDRSIIVWQNNYSCDEIYMGTYSSKEKALEVLDEIQELILKLDKRITHYELDCVYEMPKE